MEASWWIFQNRTKNDKQILTNVSVDVMKMPAVYSRMLAPLQVGVLSDVQRKNLGSSSKHILASLLHKIQLRLISLGSYVGFFLI